MSKGSKNRTVNFGKYWESDLWDNLLIKKPKPRRIKEHDKEVEEDLFKLSEERPAEPPK
jgi:hypothetical protein